MSEGKSKDKRLEEAEKTNAEVTRSLQVAEMKKAHKLIEDVEKERKRSPIQSVCGRLTSHTKWLITLSKSVTEDINEGKVFNPQVYLSTVENITQMYESIRYDYKKTLELKDEDFEHLFPKIGVKLYSGIEFGTSLSNIAEQEIHMKLYCNRFLY
jgi:hypothetical protein